MAVLLVAASIIPITISSLLDIHGTRELQTKNILDLLSARADQVANRIDIFHFAYQKSVAKFATLPAIIEFCSKSRQSTAEEKYVLETLLVQPTIDSNIRGFAILDLKGKVTMSTEPGLLGKNLSYYSFVRQSLEQETIVSDIFVAGPEVGSQPTVAYLQLVKNGGGKVVGLVALWVKAESLWSITKSFNALAGPGSFASVFNNEGIRIAHTQSDEIVFHPAGPLSTALIEQLTAEKHYGEKTRETLEDVRGFPEQFERAKASEPDSSLIYASAPENNLKNYSVARRLTSIPWTIFYMIPENSLLEIIAQRTQQKVLLALAILSLAILTGFLFTRTLLQPIQTIANATDRFANGDLKARACMQHMDEIGQLGRTFNAMAEKIELQSESLTAAKDSLEISNKELDAFTYSVSHDLRAPLRAIDGFSRILIEDYRSVLPEATAPYLQRIRHNTQKMGKLVDDLLAFSRLGRHALSKKKVDTDQLVKEILEELKSEINSRPVDLKVAALEPCFGDASLLKQVWTNLISNALKYSRKKETSIVEIGMAAPDAEGNPVYFVKDNGVGFDMAYQHKLFGVFQRLHLEEEFEGTGVGLAIVQRVIQKHGGRVWAEAAVNKGATFYFSLKQETT